jgi:hypothetical protein
MKSLRLLALALGAAALTACDYEKNAVQDLTGPLPAARIKFFNFGVNAPGVNFYANDRKMTAISSVSGTESTVGTNSGQAGAGGLYVGIDPGQYTLSGRIAAATDKDLPVATLSTSIADGKAYSYYLSGIYDATAKKVDAFVVEDPVPASTDFGLAHVRFVNAISNSSPMTLYARNATTGAEVPLGGAVAYKAAGAFTTLPAGTYDLITRTTGSTATAITRTGVAFAGGRVYTIASRGNMTVTSTTAADRPQLDNTANR